MSTPVVVSILVGALMLGGVGGSIGARHQIRSKVPNTCVWCDVRMRWWQNRSLCPDCQPEFTAKSKTHRFAPRERAHQTWRRSR